LRRIILGIAAIAVSGVMQLAAQQAPSRQSPVQPSPHPLKHALSAQAPSAPEAIIDATELGSPLLLDKGWRIGIMSNPAAANPEFDDSGWATRDAQASFAEVPDVGQSTGTPAGASVKSREPYAWYRLHLKLAPHHGPLALLIELPVSQNATISSQTFDLDVFANGHHVRPEGPHGDEPARYQQISRIYNLNLPPSETSLVLVVRSIYIPMG